MENKADILARAELFRQLHASDEIFIAPNPWDAGSARILESLGFKALATTSAGAAFSMAKADGNTTLSLHENLANAKAIMEAVSIPVSADLENGYGKDPGAVADTILLAAETGLAGGSIEDATGDPAKPIYDFAFAVERVEAAIKITRSLGRPFMLTARAENLIYRKDDLKDTIARLEAFAIAGADVVFAPGLKTREQITAAVKAVYPVHVNVLMGLDGIAMSLNELQDLGVKRISVGSSLFRKAYNAVFEAGRSMLEKGAFDFADGSVSYSVYNKLFEH
ncbi:MAG: isocitrate lyase/phosphoenolpyruvate mutase family protein [Chitinophagaceae bacterium]|nr:MAG: isocitrate lyase/phosphoenolpyruvate mutase family protein [Chitinophagaceae bacterium]